MIVATLPAKTATGWLATTREPERFAWPGVRVAPLSEARDSTFTISNLGMFGIDSFDAVINPPHGAILAVGAGTKKPIVDDDQIVVAQVMTVTLSVDHRVIDGALGAQLLGAIRDNLEDPMVMLA